MTNRNKFIQQQSKTFFIIYDVITPLIAYEVLCLLGRLKNSFNPRNINGNVSKHGISLEAIFFGAPQMITERGGFRFPDYCSGDGDWKNA